MSIIIGKKIVANKQSQFLTERVIFGLNVTIIESSKTIYTFFKKS